MAVEENKKGKDRGRSEPRGPGNDRGDLRTVTGSKLKTLLGYHFHVLGKCKFGMDCYDSHGDKMGEKRRATKKNGKSYYGR